ncbi:MAG: hypothetical protein LBL99_01735, partial [Holosporaceae bacterium]|nr:hypothetical protein [Holosporaceae bacterium]
MDKAIKFKKLIFAFVAILIFLTANATPVVVNVNKGVMKPVDIAINLYVDSDTYIEEEFTKVVNNDLKSTFLFRPIPKSAFMQVLRGIGQRPNFPLWALIKSQYLANVEIKIEGNLMRVSMVLYDVVSQSAVGTMSASGDRRDWRKLAHIAANSIYERVTGEVGYFDTKILYVSTRQLGRGRKIYRLAMMDQDGYDHKFLTDGSTIVLTPRFSPTGKEFSFFSYRERIVNGRRVPLSASVYRYDMLSKRTELIAHFKGMTYAPRYSPSGNLLIFSLSDRGSSSIYTFDIITKKLTRLTK